jgi:hypothetical protein
MTIEVLTFAFGGFLLLLGLLGGGFELREVKIAKVGWAPRLSSIVLGLVFLIVGFNKIEVVAPSPSPSPSPSPDQKYVDFFVHDELGSDQLVEQVSINVDGRQVGQITVTREFPTSAITVTIPSGGTHSYSVNAQATFDVDGQPVEHIGVGQGMIDIQKGDHFHMEGGISGNTWLISLVENGTDQLANN